MTEDRGYAEQSCKEKSTNLHTMITAMWHNIHTHTHGQTGK